MKTFNKNNWSQCRKERKKEREMLHSMQQQQWQNWTHQLKIWNLRVGVDTKRCSTGWLKTNHPARMTAKSQNSKAFGAITMTTTVAKNSLQLLAGCAMLLALLQASDTDQNPQQIRKPAKPQFSDWLRALAKHRIMACSRTRQQIDWAPLQLGGWQPDAVDTIIVCINKVKSMHLNYI